MAHYMNAGAQNHLWVLDTEQSKLFTIKVKMTDSIFKVCVVTKRVSILSKIAMCAPPFIQLTLEVGGAAVRPDAAPRGRRRRPQVSPQGPGRVARSCGMLITEALPGAGWRLMPSMSSHQVF